MEADEHVLADMFAEWTDIQMRASRQALGTWQVAFEAMVREEGKLRSEGKWVRGHADVFGVLGISRAEIRHTRFVAWLMDPAARHGLGTRFLQRVLARTFPGETFANLDRAIPVCEVTRAECRLDIVVWGGDFTIVIEAKVDADEGAAQCDYQYAQLSSEPGARFIFLTPRGRLPRSATGDAKEAFVPLSFAAIREDLRDALAEAPDANGRGAAEDYLRTLEREFPWPS